MLAGVLALVILVVRLYPETPLARSLHRWLVEWPLDLARRAERRHLILVAIILCTGHLALAVGSAELALAYAVDLSIYYDAFLVTTLASAGARLRAAWRALTERMRCMLSGRPRARPRSRRTAASVMRKDASANDDDPWGVCTGQAA